LVVNSTEEIDVLIIEGGGGQDKFFLVLSTPLTPSQPHSVLRLIVVGMSDNLFQPHFPCTEFNLAKLNLQGG